MQEYINLVFNLISFKYKHPEYAKQIDAAMPILIDKTLIKAIDADLAEEAASC